MIDEFGLYPREEPFDPFSVMLFKALQVVSFLFFLALLAISPEAKDGKVDSKAEFIVTMDWPDNHPDDLDLFVQDPAGNIAWYRHREAGFMVLERDDRGGANDFIIVNGKKISSPIREEIVTIRGIVAGEYTVNVSHLVATTNAPVPATVKVQKLNPTTQVIFDDKVFVDHTGDEKTAVRFTLDADGNIEAWIGQFLRTARPYPKIWPLNPYISVSTGNPRPIRRFLSYVHGQVWFSEVGCIVWWRLHGRLIYHGEAYAVKSTKNIFRLASISPRITRVYYYHWRSPGTPQSAKKSTWDAGLITANGAARQALYVVAKALHRQIQTATPRSF